MGGEESRENRFNEQQVTEGGTVEIRGKTEAGKKSKRNKTCVIEMRQKRGGGEKQRQRRQYLAADYLTTVNDKNQRQTLTVHRLSD